jgi:hypothetical protein
MMTKKVGRIEEAGAAVIDLANRLIKDAQSDEDTDMTVIGLLFAAINVSLQQNHPCGRSYCEECAQINTPEKRLAELLRVVERCARLSRAFHAVTDARSNLHD